MALALAGCGSTEKEAETVKPEIVTEAIEEIKETPTPEPTKEVVTEEPAPVVEEVKEETPEPTEEVKEEADALANVTAISPAKTMYITDEVNIRKGPSTDYDIVSHGKMNQEISVIGRDKDGWYEFMLGEEPVFVSDKYVSEQAIDMEALLAAAAAQAQAQAQAQPATPETPAAPAAVPTKAPVIVKAPAGVLFIGDSRCVQMREATMGGGCSWICQNGARYEWFRDTAVPQADTMVGKGTKVVICMGVNDPGDVGQYAALTNAKAVEWVARGAKVYYVSVNPVWENPYTSEDQVKAFNASMPGQLIGVRWIDTHTVLQGTGYKLVDGLHYDGPTYMTIFSSIIGSL